MKFSNIFLASPILGETTILFEGDNFNIICPWSSGTRNTEVLFSGDGTPEVEIVSELNQSITKSGFAKGTGY